MMELSIRSFKTLLLALLTLCVAGLLTGCSGGSVTDETGHSLSLRSGTPTLKAVTVTPSSSSLYVGATQQLTATATFSSGSPTNVTATATWSSSNTAIATVNPSGLVTPITPGTVTITATDGTVKGKATVKVLTTLTSIAVTPGLTTLPANTTQALVATGSYDNNTTKNLTSTVVWASSNAAVATVSSTGLVVALMPGSVTVTASTSVGAVSTVVGHATLTVDTASLRTVSVTPAKKTLASGGSQQFTATGIFSDGTKHVLALPVVSWSASPTSVASVSSAGLVTGKSAGSATVTAKHTASGISGTAALTVTAATLVSVAVTPPMPTVSAGLTQQFTATGTYSDGSTNVVTSSVNWSVSTATVASVTSAGLATSLSPGSTTVTATDPKTGKSGAATLHVTAAVLTAITLLPGPPLLPAGTTAQLTATGTFSDGSSANVTSVVTWSAAQSAVATVSNAAGTQGLVSTFAPGTTLISVVDPSTGVSQQETLTVTVAVLKSIALTPTSPSLPVGVTVQLAATGTYSDGTTMDVTQNATWSSSSGAVSVSNAAGSSGQITAVSVGSSLIVATDPATGIAGRTTATATGVALQAITVSPATASAPVGSYATFQATATYTDGSTVDLTRAVAWSTTGLAVADAYGDVFGTAVGNATLVATDPTTGSSGSATLSVTAATLVGLEPTSAYGSSLPVGASTSVLVGGMFSDGQRSNVTGTLTWSIDNPAVGTFATGACNNLNFAAVSTGVATLTGTDPTTGLSVQVVINVVPNDGSLSLVEFEVTDGSGTTLTPANASGVSIYVGTPYPGGGESFDFPSFGCEGELDYYAPVGPVVIDVQGLATTSGLLALPESFDVQGTLELTGPATFQLALPSEPLTLTVTDPTGAPVQGAQVYLGGESSGCPDPLTACEPNGWASFDGYGEQPVTDASGHVTLFAFPTASTFVQVTPPMGADLLQVTTTLDDTSGSANVSLPAGARLRIRFLDLVGAPLTPDNTGVLVASISSADGSVAVQAYADAEGYYTAVLPVGTATVTFTAGWIGNSGLAAPAGFTFTGTLPITGDVVLDVPIPTKAMTFAVSDAAGSAVPGAQLSMNFEGGTLPPSSCGSFTACSMTGVTPEPAGAVYPPYTDGAGDVTVYGVATPFTLYVGPPASSPLFAQSFSEDATSQSQFVVTMVDGVPFNFRIVDPHGNPLIPASDGSFNFSIEGTGNIVGGINPTADPSGNFSTLIPPGIMTFNLEGLAGSFQAGGMFPANFYFSGNLSVTGPFTGDLTLPIVALTVDVTDGSGNPVQGAIITGGPNLGGGSLPNCGPLFTACGAGALPASDVNGMSPILTDATGMSSFYGFASTSVALYVSPPAGSPLFEDDSWADASQPGPIHVQLQ